MRYLLIALLVGIGQFLYSQCSNNNDFHESVSAPTVLGNTVNTDLHAGEYTTVENLVKDRVYLVTNCGDGAFDTQITIYPSGSSLPAAANDDYFGCSTQSTIYFSPTSSGDYDILVDKYDCDHDVEPSTQVEFSLVEKPQPVFTIPVVVHIVYNTGTQNITNAQVTSQITALNADFRRTNADLSNAPTRFRGFSKDMEVEFCLATIDPNGNATNGITRKNTSTAAFSIADDFMKYDANGGTDAWPATDYLNIWVCNLSGSLLGYAQFPGTGLAATDGVVVDYEYFGTIGTVTSPFNLGRTTTHEVGHWLNLKHIWGDDGTACTGSDFVEDTPNQGGSTSGCPNTKQISCGNSFRGGDMYVNYMDYSDDACLKMFTYWQYKRVEAVLNSTRSSLQNSGSCGVVGRDEALDFEINVEVFPQPARNQVEFAIDAEPGRLRDLEIQVFDLLGRNMVRKTKLQRNHQLDLEDYSSGIYIYRITHKGEIVLQDRFLVQE